MSTFVLVHGAWHGGWCWDGLAGRLRAAGHDVLAPTLAGLGERTAELAPGIGLSDHADEIAQVLRGLSPPDDVVAVGHAPRLTPQPIRTFEQATRLTGAIDRVPGRTILCRDLFGLGFDRFAREIGYPSVRLDTGHDAMLTEPDELAALLVA